jgi:Flp pilus assembly protein TadG
MMLKMRYKRTTRVKRRAVAAVEFAVVLPPLLLLLMAAIEVGGAFAVQHSLQEASMNGCRIYAIRDSTQQQATAMIERSLAEDGITGYSLAFNPPMKTVFAKDLQPITVTVSVPSSNVGLGIKWFLGGTTLSASSTLPSDSGTPLAQ